MSTTTDYEDILSISKFKGINRASDGHNMDMAYAHDGLNFDTELGGLKPMLLPKKITDSTTLEISYVPSGTETMMFLTKRYQDNFGVIGRADTDYNEYMILVENGKLYFRHQAGGEYTSSSSWTEIKDSSGQSFDFTGATFDWVAYELNYAPPETLTSTIVTDIYTNETEYYYFSTTDYKYYLVETDDGTTAKYTDGDGTEHTLTVGTDKVRLAFVDAPVDCVFATNTTDGMYCIYAPISEQTLKCVKVTVQPTGASESKFGCIALHNERLWGSAIDTDDNKMMYCAPNDPFNWEANTDIPEDGAGDIQLPEWNGDSIVALKSFANYLIMLKKHSIWRMSGTTPDEFSWLKCYGEGTIEENTIAIYNSSMLFVGDDGEIKAFDGSSVSTFKYKSVNNASGLKGSSVARVIGGKYFIGTSSGVYIYDFEEGTFNYCGTGLYRAAETNGTDMYYTEWVVDEEEETIYVYTYKYFGDAYGKNPTTITQCNRPVTWESSWQDLGAKNITKSGFAVYLMPELQDGYSTDKYHTPFTCTVTIETEKKSKSKTVDIEIGKCKRVHLNVSGRQFKLKLEMPADSSTNLIPWKLSTGVQIYTEYDYD